MMIQQSETLAALLEVWVRFPAHDSQPSVAPVPGN